MNEITAVRYNVPDNDHVEITFDDASIVSQPYNEYRYKYTDQLNEWLAEGNEISAYDQYYGMTIEQVREQNQNQVDADCSAYIYSYWSAPAQQNVSNGLYDELTTVLCKDEISEVLSQNKTFIDDIELLTTNNEIDAYVDSIVRVTITGGN